MTLEIFSKLEQKWLSHCESGKKTTVLSIDGGGTGAVVSAAALVHLEDQIQFKTGNSHSLIIDFFDVVVGTGVGVVFAAMLTADDGSGRPLFSAKDAVTFVAEKQKQKLRNSATAMAAVTSTSLASRLSTPKAAAPSHSYSPHHPIFRPTPILLQPRLLSPASILSQSPNLLSPQALQRHRRHGRLWKILCWRKLEV